MNVLLILVLLLILEIEKAYVNDTLVEFDYTDAVADLTLGANTTIAHHQVYKSRYLNALRDADEGELNVKLPADCIKKVEITLLDKILYISLTFLIRYLMETLLS
jgi:hypothetical protein